MTRSSRRVLGGPIMPAAARALRCSRAMGERAMSETMRAVVLERPGRAAARRDLPRPRAARGRGARQRPRLRRLPHRPARDEGRGGVPDALRARPRDRGHRRASSGRASATARAGDRVVCRVHHAVRALPPLRARPRRAVRDVLRDEPAARHALRRHDAGCAAPTARRSRCTRWPGSPSTRSCPRPTCSPCPRRSSWRARPCSAAPCSPPTARSPTPARVSPGDRVAVVAAGGVGLNIVALARVVRRAPGDRRRRRRRRSSRRRASSARPTSSTPPPATRSRACAS